ncbi:hypothetical protein ACMTAU_08245, partial [Alcaligenes pakistanensis]
NQQFSLVSVPCWLAAYN